MEALPRYGLLPKATPSVRVRSLGHQGRGRGTVQQLKCWELVQVHLTGDYKESLSAARVRGQSMLKKTEWKKLPMVHIKLRYFNKNIIP